MCVCVCVMCVCVERERERGDGGTNELELSQLLTGSLDLLNAGREGAQTTTTEL